MSWVASWVASWPSTWGRRSHRSRSSRSRRGATPAPTMPARCSRQWSHTQTRADWRRPWPRPWTSWRTGRYQNRWNVRVAGSGERGVSCGGVVRAGHRRPSLPRKATTTCQRQPGPALIDSRIITGPVMPRRSRTAAEHLSAPSARCAPDAALRHRARLGRPPCRTDPPLPTVNTSSAHEWQQRGEAT